MLHNLETHLCLVVFEIFGTTGWQKCDIHVCLGRERLITLYLPRHVGKLREWGPGRCAFHFSSTFFVLLLPAHVPSVPSHHLSQKQLYIKYLRVHT
jgi:hypothetical protein